MKRFADSRAWRSAVVQRAAATMPSLVSAIALVALPKCPFCLVAYGAAMGLVGVPLLVSVRWLPSVLAVALLGALLIRGARRKWNSPMPMLFAMAAGLVLVASRFVVWSPTLMVAAGLILIGSHLWDAVANAVDSRPLDRPCSRFCSKGSTVANSQSVAALGCAPAGVTDKPAPIDCSIRFEAATQEALSPNFRTRDK